jgi:hypothetical protein
MRLTDNRYATERSQFELALRMIGHEARTRTIKVCTGLSDDRIRKLYATYFRDGGSGTVKRRRGKSPQQVGLFVKNPHNQLEATTLIALFCADRAWNTATACVAHSRLICCCTGCRNSVSSGPGTSCRTFPETTSCIWRCARAARPHTFRMPMPWIKKRARAVRYPVIAKGTADISRPPSEKLTVRVIRATYRKLANFR